LDGVVGVEKVGACKFKTFSGGNQRGSSMLLARGMGIYLSAMVRVSKNVKVSKIANVCIRVAGTLKKKK
jgi:hypothetical protein